MIFNHDDRVRIIRAEKQLILDEAQSRPGRAQSRGISDEVINDMVNHQRFLDITDVRAIAYWSAIILKDEFKKSDVTRKYDTREFELLKMMIHAFALER